VRARIIPFRYSPDLRGERCRDRAETKETHPFHECYVFLKIALRKIEIALKKKSEKKRRNHFMSAMFFRLSASCSLLEIVAPHQGTLHPQPPPDGCAPGQSTAVGNYQCTRRRQNKRVGDFSATFYGGAQGR
jgi:hypothetical protein